MATSVSARAHGTPAVSLKSSFGILLFVVGLVMMAFGLFVMGVSVYVIFLEETRSLGEVVISGVAFFVGAGVAILGSGITYASTSLMEDMLK